MSERWLDEDAGPIVRPYAMTRGRTRPVGGSFDLIASVMAVGPADPVPGLEPEHQEILDLCRNARRVAEVASELALPVGVVRVLLSDLYDRGLLALKTPAPSREVPDREILNAVIEGLRAL